MKRAISGRMDWLLGHLLRLAPPAFIVLVASVVGAQEAISPHRRVVKLGVLLGLMTLMLRFDMAYSVYLFTLLFPFPSGISIGSTNSVLMTLIPLIWIVRANSTKHRIFRKTAADRAIILFLFISIISFFSVETHYGLIESTKILWRMFCATAFYYMITNFIDDEKKLERMCKVACIACAAVMATAVVELIAPGTTIIPGWISLSSNPMSGKLGYRMQGLRVGGAFESHGMLSDFGTQLFLFMLYFALRARNAITKTAWILTVVLTFVAIMSTANRGATAGLALAVLLALVYFRRAIGFHRIVLIVASAAVMFAVTEMVLKEHTLAVSVLERFEKTEFEGLVPENRTMTWVPALVRSLEHPFIGHGLFYDTGRGLTGMYWPHNGYIFYLYTIGGIGLGAFIWIMVTVFRQTQQWRMPDVRGTHAGNLLALTQIWFLVMSFEQIRTDHQREDIYPYIVWMCFGVAMAAANVVRSQSERARTPTLALVSD